GRAHDDGPTDLDDRLAPFGRSAEMPSRRGLFADDQFEDGDVVWEDEDRGAVGPAGYDDAARYDGSATYDDLDEELEELVEEYAAEEQATAEYATEYEDAGYEAAGYEEPVTPRKASIFAAPGIIDETAV